MLSYLETNSLDDEGLLRVPGSSARINTLQQELETNLNNPDICPFDGVKSTDVCSLLKQFIRYAHTHARITHKHTHTHSLSQSHTSVMLNCFKFPLHDGTSPMTPRTKSVHGVHTLAHSLHYRATLFVVYLCTRTHQINAHTMLELFGGKLMNEQMKHMLLASLWQISEIFPHHY